MAIEEILEEQDELDLLDLNEEEEEVEEKEEVEEQEEVEEKEEVEEEEEEEKEEDELDIQIIEFNKEDYKAIEELGYPVDEAMEAEITELLEDGFTPDQINKLYKRVADKRKVEKQAPVKETAEEATARLNRDLPKEVKKDYKDMTKVMDDIFKDHPKYAKHLKTLKRDTQYLEMFHDIYKHFTKAEDDGVDINEERLKSDRRPKEKVDLQKAFDKYHAFQTDSKSEEAQIKARNKIAKLLNKEDREKFLQGTFTFDPKEAWK